MTNNSNQTKSFRAILPKGSNLFGSSYIVDDYKTSGGMNSDIYTCHHKDQPNKVLCAKIVYRKSIDVDEEKWNKILNEATNSLRVINQPNLIQTYRVLSSKSNSDDPSICIIMDWVEGISLNEYLSAQGCLIPKTALSIFLKILKGIKVLHNFKHQIIHRDLKPENIMLSHDLSKVTIIDFGIATVLDKTEQTLALNGQTKILNEENHLFGTAQYICPDALEEYAKKDVTSRNISVQEDFYSLGIILYKMIMGDFPFDYSDCKDERQIIRTILRFDMINISANPTIPNTLENIIFKCIASKKEDKQYRYTKVEEIIEDVEKCIPLLNKNDNTKLIKPLNKRIYQKAKIINIDAVKNNQKAYKKWWFFAVVMAVSIILLVACIIVFFLI